jgi:hypothetical protein
MKFYRGIIAYIGKLIDSDNVTSMSRFLSLNVVMSVLIGWIINSAWLGYMINIPTSVLEFTGIVVGGRAIQGAADAIGCVLNRGNDNDK